MVEVQSLTCEKFNSLTTVTYGGSEYADCPNDGGLSGGIWLMKSEMLRLETYKNWPSGHTQRPHSLAKAGLFYTDVGDRVQCPFCLGVLKKWQPGDDPMSEHRIHFPRCKFVKEDNAGNIPILRSHVPKSVKTTHRTLTQTRKSRLGAQTSRCNVTRSKEYKNEATLVLDEVDFTKEVTRLNSFSRWPTGMTQSPDVLAYAGFYHAPRETKPDRVQCAYCLGKLYNWREGDDPMLEHARCFPRCPYIKLCMGEQLINDLLSHHQAKHELTEVQRPENNEEMPGDIQPGVVLSLLEMGFPSKLITEAVEKCKRENSSDLKVQTLVDILLETEDETEILTTSTNLIPTQKRITPLYTGQSTGEHVVVGLDAVTSGSQGDAPSPAPVSMNYSGEVRTNGDDDSALMSRQVRFIYKPCGHQACCRPCSLRTTTCPACGVIVTESVAL